MTVDNLQPAESAGVHIVDNVDDRSRFLKWDKLRSLLSEATTACPKRKRTRAGESFCPFKPEPASLFRLRGAEKSGQAKSSGRGYESNKARESELREELTLAVLANFTSKAMT